MMRALDLFSAAAGGWSLGLHRAGFVTVAACEIVEWRRILYSENFPHVRLYEDVRDLTADRLVSDLGFLPDIVVGSPPCQDISVANTKGKGVEGERSGLYFEAIRIVGECRPRWFALENSANLRTRGADRVLGELEALGYACEPFVVAAAHVGANHERKRSWLIGFDPEQLADTDEARQPDGRLEPGLRPQEIADPGCGDERGDAVFDSDSDRQSDSPGDAEMGGSEGAGGVASEPWADWNGGLAHHLRVDDGLSAWVADTRIALGGPRGTAAAGLIVEAFGDAVVPQIPEAIGRAILRTEIALNSVFGATALSISDAEGASCSETGQ